MAHSKERCQELMEILERTSMRPKGAAPPVQWLHRGRCAL